MKIVIRNPRRRELEIEGRRRVRDVLRELGLSEESHIVVRGEEVLTRDEWVESEDRIEIISAISGGS